jgi:hypothetical protein
MSLRTCLVLVGISVVLILSYTQAQSTKTSWPELVGTRGTYAQRVINSERPDLTVQIVKYGQMVTMDYREDRVRIYLNQSGKVGSTPTIG